MEPDLGSRTALALVTPSANRFKSPIAPALVCRLSQPNKNKHTKNKLILKKYCTEFLLGLTVVEVLKNQNEKPAINPMRRRRRIIIFFMARFYVMDFKKLCVSKSYWLQVQRSIIF
jgi:hypothetical protein